MESPISGLARFGLGKLVDLPNWIYESHSMRVACIIISIILHTAHNIIHISHIIFQIIRSYVMRPWNHGLNIKTSKNEGSTYGTSTRDPSLANRESPSFIHMYIISFIHILVQPLVIHSM